MDLYKLTAHELHDKLVKKEISSVELTENVYSRIDEVEDKVQAYVTLDKENALAQAAKVDAKIAAGEEIAPLAGIPGAIKDNICTKGLLTTCSSKMLANVVPIYDAHVISKLRADDAIFTGKTNMDEFAMGSTTESSYFHKTYNPWNLERVPGGSSGGSAAAIAAGEAIWSLGSDTGGSIRQPAAFNGIVGLKPTYGRVSRYGLIAFASSMDQIGPLTRSVYDNALMLNAISGHDSRDFTSSSKEVPDFTKGIDEGVKGMRIAGPKEYFAEGVDADVQQAVKDAIKKFEELGATVDEVSLPHTKYGVPVYYIIASSEASSNLQRFDGIRYGFRAEDVKNLEDVYVRSRSEGFGDEVKRRIMLGTFSLSAGTYDAFFKKAAQVRTLICRDYENVFENHDLILGPTAPTTAYGIGEKIDDPVTMYMNDILTIPVNLAGLPGMSLPAGFSDGLPIGMQLVAPRFREDTLYKAGFAFEQATDFHKAVPEIGGQN